MSSTSSNTSSAQRTSKFAEHFLDKTQEKISNRLYLAERRERERMVVLAFDQWKQKYPKQCNKLDWEASYHDIDEEYDETDGDNAEPILVNQQEGEIKEAHETEGKVRKLLATAAMKSRREKVQDVLRKQKRLCVLARSLQRNKVRQVGLKIQTLDAIWGRGAGGIISANDVGRWRRIWEDEFIVGG